MKSFMKYEQIFVDTNFLVYAHDQRDVKKYKIANSTLYKWWDTNIVPSISAQVLHEFYVSLVRIGASTGEAVKLVELYSCWRVIANDTAVLKDAMQIIVRYKLSLWDSLIVAAAIRAGAEELWTEDLQHGQKFGRLQVINPFR